MSLHTTPAPSPLAAILAAYKLGGDTDAQAVLPDPAPDPIRHVGVYKISKGAHLIEVWTFEEWRSLPSCVMAKLVPTSSMIPGIGWIRIVTSRNAAEIREAEYEVVNEIAKPGGLGPG